MIRLVETTVERIRRHPHRLRFWRQTCCNATRWSGTPRCDRCGVPGVQWKWVTLGEAMALTGAEERVDRPTLVSPAPEDVVVLPDVTALEGAQRQELAAVANVQPVVSTPEPSEPLSRQKHLKQEVVQRLPAPSIWKSEEVVRVWFYGWWAVMGAHGTFGALFILAGSGLERVLFGPLAALPVVMLGIMLVDALKSARRRVNRGAPSADTSRAQRGQR